MLCGFLREMAAHLKRWCGPAKSGRDCSFWNREGHSRSQNVILQERRSNATRTHCLGSLEPADRASRTHTPGQSTTARSGSMHAPCRRPGPRSDRKSSVRTRCTKTNAPRLWSTRASGEFRLPMLWRSSRSVSWNCPFLHVCRSRQPGFDIFPIFLSNPHWCGDIELAILPLRRPSVGEYRLLLPVLTEPGWGGFPAAHRFRTPQLMRMSACHAARSLTVPSQRPRKSSPAHTRHADKRHGLAPGSHSIALAAA